MGRRPALGGAQSPVCGAVFEPTIEENERWLRHGAQSVVPVDKALESRQVLLGRERLYLVAEIVGMPVFQAAEFHEPAASLAGEYSTAGE